MESPDLKTPDDEKLLALLRAADSAPLPDDGFTARVLQALPPPRVRPWWLPGRDALIVGAVVLVGVWLIPSGTGGALTSLRDLANALHENSAALVVAALTLAAWLLTDQDEESRAN